MFQTEQSTVLRWCERSKIKVGENYFNFLLLNFNYYEKSYFRSLVKVVNLNEMRDSELFYRVLLISTIWYASITSPTLISL